MALGIEIEGQQPVPGKRGIMVNVTDVGPGYFQTMGTPLLRGREFSPLDGPDAPRIAIINEAMAKRFWPGQDPIGRHLNMKGPQGPPSRESYEIVGVVKTGKYRSLSEAPLPFMYRSIVQFYHPASTLVVRTTGDPQGLLPAVRREVQALDPNVVPFDLATMREYMALPLFPAHTTGLLLGGFGFLALVLAVAGLYGVMSYTVSQRTHEIGIRVALGAEQHDVLKLVVGQLTGIIIGLLGAFAATRALSSLLYGIRPTDPVTFAAISLVLTGVALAASYIPARRATKIDPMVALRYE
jgi:putative ABC transport system permease protein